MLAVVLTPDQRCTSDCDADQTAHNDHLPALGPSKAFANLTDEAVVRAVLLAGTGAPPPCVVPHAVFCAVQSSFLLLNSCIARGRSADVDCGNYVGQHIAAAMNQSLVNVSMIEQRRR
jgi:hypothetical protein